MKKLARSHTANQWWGQELKLGWATSACGLDHTAPKGRRGVWSTLGLTPSEAAQSLAQTASDKDAKTRVMDGLGLGPCSDGGVCAPRSSRTEHTELQQHRLGLEGSPRKRTACARSPPPHPERGSASPRPEPQAGRLGPTSCHQTRLAKSRA